jgi:hypothetical protein
MEALREMQEHALNGNLACVRSKENKQIFDPTGNKIGASHNARSAA